MKVQRKFARMADGTRIYYEIFGQGFPLFLLHGNGENGKYFSKQIPEFSQHFQLFVVDSRGQGKSNNRANQLNFSLMGKLQV